jgi:kumamolisin
MSQQLVPMQASHRDPLPGARRVADVPPGEELEFSIVVRRKPGGTEKALRTAADQRPEPVSERRRRLTEDAGADQADLDRVTSYVTGAGMQVESASAASRTVTVRATAEQAKAAFGVSLGRYEVGDLRYRGREGTVHVPADLTDVVQAVLGLDNRPQARAHLKQGQALAEGSLPHPQTGPVTLLPAITASEAAAPAPRPDPQPMWPTQVASLYRFPQDLNGSGETIAIIELGGGYRPQELSRYFRRANVPLPQVEAVGVLGGKNAPGGDADGEVLLDIEVAGSIAPGARLAVYFAAPSDQGFIGAVTAAVHDAQRSPSVISISWGGPEDSWTDQARGVFDDVLVDAAALGITVFAAAGDHGAGDAMNPADGKAHTDYPASSPYMIGCGGTTLFNQDGLPGEVAWNDGDGWATGGGISDCYQPPDWQKVTLPANVNGTGKPGRGVPDVAGNADIASGYIVLVDGKWTPTGGTSAVAPLYAGLTALLNQGLGHRAGALLPTLYTSASSAVFRDVTSGNNTVPASRFGPAVTGYQAGTGWDACTGLGSIDGTALLTELRSAATAAAAMP